MNHASSWRPHSYDHLVLSSSCIRTSDIGAIAGAAEQTLSARWNHQIDSYTQEEVRIMENGRRVKNHGRFRECP